MFFSCEHIDLYFIIVGSYSIICFFSFNRVVAMSCFISLEVQNEFTFLLIVQSSELVVLIHKNISLFSLSLSSSIISGLVHTGSLKNRGLFT